jgi:hypothetical protein
MVEEQGRTTQEVCDDLGIERADLMKLLRSERDRIPLRRLGGAYLWSPAAVAMVRQCLAEQRDREAILRQTEEAENYVSALYELQKTAEGLRKLGAGLLAVHKTLLKNPPTVTGFIHSLPDRSGLSPREVEERSNRWVNESEGEDAILVPLEEFSAEKLRIQLRFSMLATVRSYGLELPHATPDFEAISDFLRQRYG